MPDPINPISSSFMPSPRTQNTGGAGDAQKILANFQSIANPGSAQAAGNTNGALPPNGMTGLLNDPKATQALNGLQNNPGMAVQGVGAGQDSQNLGNRTLSENDTLQMSTSSGFAALTGGAVAPAFGEVVEGFIKNVNQSQQKSEELTEALALGEPVDVHQVMLALNEASDAMALTLQVRSHALKAYQDLMQIPL
ncbi:flagellar hook-basal body complex protein FliE [Armatimonas sp.]|uniref:flagellar hook-basal body complex protein FliE n=1 Tax=Armatimonas sp. TaxID=1872638 RepID=UPI00286C3FCA|nr:flagellar hook-basal body complex protein FliE [Armatimonas sp.]